MRRVMLPEHCLLVTTGTGSRYAFARTTDGTWWMRPRAKPAGVGPLSTLPDVWRPIRPLAPWPPVLRRPLDIEFLSNQAIAFASGLVIPLVDEVRYTSWVMQVETWSPTDLWPGPLPDDTEAAS